MAKKKSKIRVNPLAAIILKSILRMIFNKQLNVKLNLPDEIYNLEPPYLLLPNHQGFWDPFLAGVYLKHNTFYITSDAVFRAPLFKFLLRFLGAIPKTKAQSDLDALKNIFNIKERGHLIGIFPEGQRTWDGRTLSLIKSTAKLVRMLKVPVVTVVFKGGYYSHPRWGTSIRKGELNMDYQLLFTGEEVGKMKVSEIHSRLTEALSHDEVEYQRQHKLEFTGGRYAENIEQFLFACPSCDTIAGFRSKHDKFECKGCGHEWQINSRQLINAARGDTRFDNVRDWNSWQIERLHKMLDQGFGSEEVLLEDGGIVFHTGFKSRKPRFLAAGSMQLRSDEIIMFNNRKKVLKIIPIQNLSGINVQNKEILDIYFENVLYIVRDPGRRFNAYKWLKAVDYLQREKFKMNLPD